MQNSQHDVPAAFSAFADRVFVQAVDVPADAPPIPAWTSGFIMMQAADVFDMQLEAGKRLRGYRVMAVGPMTRPTFFRDAPVRVRGIAIRLRPGVLPRLFDGETLVDATRNLSDRVDVSATLVAEEAALLTAACRALETLAPAVAPRLRGLELFERALRLIEDGPRELSVQAIADALAVSTVTLRNAFHANVGLAPKRFLRVRRMEQVLESFFENPDPAYLSRIYGFADQSHFIREFRSFCGATPTEFLARVATPEVRDVHNNLA